MPFIISIMINLTERKRDLVPRVYNEKNSDATVKELILLVSKIKKIHLTSFNNL